MRIKGKILIVYFRVNGTRQDKQNFIALRLSFKCCIRKSSETRNHLYAI